MSVLGQFVDLDDPDSFVWLRGFADMDTRRRGLTAFYGGSVWKAHRDAANATMLDSDNVLLLRPARSGAGFDVADSHPRAGVAPTDRGMVAAGVHYVEAPQDVAARDAFERCGFAAISELGGSLLAYLTSEPAPNDYPALPVRDETALVWFVGLAERPSFEQAWRGIVDIHRLVAEAVRPTSPPELLRLAPTPRSLLAGTAGPCAAADVLARPQPSGRSAERIDDG